MNPFLDLNKDFISYGHQHFIVLGVMFAIGFGLIWYGRRSSPKMKETIALWITGVTLFNWFMVFSLQLSTGRFDKQHDLPLHLCPIMAYTMIWWLNKKVKWYFEIAYCWILAGCSQALFTPTLQEGFPHYQFIKFFVFHSGLVIGVLYAVFVFGMRPRLRGVLNAWLLFQVFLIMIAGFNWLLGTNYAFINHPPPYPTMLDAFGPHPWYVIFGDLTALVFFFLVYSPWLLLRSKA